jgi:hypothetical protein
VSKVDITNITSFVEKSAGLTKQHISLFEHDLKNLSELPKSVLKSFSPERHSKHSDVCDYFYLLPLEFRYVAGSPPEEGTIEFPWPVRFVFRKKAVEAHLTTMEKDLEAYLGDTKPVFSVWRDIDDKDILKDLRETLSKKTTLLPLDINKGVKEIWRRGDIDAPRAAWKSAVATKVNAMDGDYMVKKDDPAEYAQAIRSPLLKTVFKVLNPKLDWPEILMIDASNGEVSIPRYSKSVKAVTNVLSEILRNN